jgi:hypothetical protein
MDILNEYVVWLRCFIFLYSMMANHTATSHAMLVSSDPKVGVSLVFFIQPPGGGVV